HVGKVAVWVQEPVEHTAPLPSFSDIAGHWAERQIIQAAMNHIVSGYPDGTFRPDHPITRAEFTVMLVNTLELDGTASLDALDAFTDKEDIGAWAREAVAKAKQANIVIGYEDGTFRPGANITRAEMAVMVARALKLNVEQH